MPNTYSKIYIHCVFAVKWRECTITSDFRDRLHAYMHGILKNDGAFPLAVGGWIDHVHVFFSMPPDKKISDLMRDLKATSSKWINDHHFVKGRFQWQNGYGAFSYAHDDIDHVIRYIMNQEQHHAKRAFREEYLQMLQEFEIGFSEDYLFEFF